MAEESISSFYVITPDTDAPIGRIFVVRCTVAGDVTVRMSGGMTHVIPVEVGYSVFPYEVLTVISASTTATATYENGA